MFKLIISTLLVAIASFVAAEEAYFKFTDGRDDFIFKLTDNAKILKAREILSGTEKEHVHVMGRIKKQSVPYNPRWDFTLDPDSITFFDHAIETCDALIVYAADHLDEVCYAFLPGCFWCPWASAITGEVKP